MQSFILTGYSDTSQYKFIETKNKLPDALSKLICYYTDVKFGSSTDHIFIYSVLDWS